MKYFSMFSGIGGFEEGIKRATNNQWECVGYSEIDKYAIQTYQKNFPNHKNYGNAKDINADELQDFDILVGGFPCQAFSIAGKRMGFQDTRGTLFFEIARIVERKRPRFLLLENVKGLLSHDGGRTFATILATLDELGYDAEWEVLNSKYFGVAQNRERVFIVGHLRGRCTQQIFPIGQDGQKLNAEIKWQREPIQTYDSQEGGGGCEYSDSEMLEDGQRRQLSIMLNGQGSQGTRVYGINGVSQTLNSCGGGLGAKSGLYCIPVLTPNRPEKRQNGRRMKENGEEMFTLTGQDVHGIAMNNRIRRLTPIECERLQGFRDNWTESVSDTQRYRQLGNAVTVNVIESIIRKLNKLQ